MTKLDWERARKFKPESPFKSKLDYRAERYLEVCEENAARKRPNDKAGHHRRISSQKAK
jgi:hypothetical protein